MGWGDCGTDEDGRPIGYLFPATCDEPGCNERIHRGLAYVCGNMHGGDELGCGRYFCAEHREIVEMKCGRVTQLCARCAFIARQEGALAPDE